MSIKGYLEGPNGQIHFRRSLETGPADECLICFHMSPYSSVIYERLIEVSRAQKKDVIAIDTPGFGNSDPTKLQPTINDYAATMISFIDQFKIQKVNLMGYHTGSKIALEVANQIQKKIGKIILVSAPIFNDQEILKMKDHYLKNDKILSADGSHLLHAWNEAKYWSMDGRSDLDIANTFHARLINPKISWWGHNAAFNYDSSKAIEKVKCPILILNPGDDLHEFTPRAKDYLQHQDSKILDLKSWSHGFLDVKTEEAAEIIFSFLYES
jgi:pimeloyl-ACP methyl ester carboxylesterase